MKKADIKVGGHYRAKVNGKVVTVRVDEIKEDYRGETRYFVTNMETNRKTMFRSAAKFRGEAGAAPMKLADLANPNNPKTIAFKEILRQGTFSPQLPTHILDQLTAEDRDRANFDTRTQEALEDAPKRCECYDPVPDVQEGEPTLCHECGGVIEEDGGDWDAPIPPIPPPVPDTEEDQPHDALLAEIERLKAQLVAMGGKQSLDPTRAPGADGSQSASATESTTAHTATATATPPTGGDTPVLDRYQRTLIVPEADRLLDKEVTDTMRSLIDTPLPGLAEYCASSEPDCCEGDPLGHDLCTGCGKPFSPEQKAQSQTYENMGKQKVGGMRGLALAARADKHQPGQPIAGMTPNAEQEAIIAAVEEEPKVLVIGAGAGTGKTATLKMLEEVMPGKGQYTAFNRDLVDESATKFKKANCRTTHQLAHAAVGRKYQTRLGSKRIRSAQMAAVLGIAPMEVYPPGNVDSDGRPKARKLSAEFLAGQVMVAITRFCQSADRAITARHFKYIELIDGKITRLNEETGESEEYQSRENNERVREYLLPFAHKAWADIVDVNGSLPFVHDHYVKIWQLGEGKDRPYIAADYILLDEAQDTAPVFLDVLKRQTHATLVLVGDDNQQIYEWRGAVNAMASFANAERRLLSQSYRYGQAVADVANSVLAELEEPTDLILRGNPAIPSRVCVVDAPKCYLYRTNAGAVGEFMRQIEAGRKPHLVGKVKDIIEWCKAVMALKAGRGTEHPELACFQTWDEVVAYSKEDEGADLKVMVKLVTTFGEEEILEAVENMPDEDKADVVIATAHKSKGREWDSVKLGQDFPNRARMADSDRRLLYVAVTRAKLALDITECPPFCGEEERTGGEDGDGEANFIPGIPIRYTTPMPTAEELAAFIAQRVAVPAPTAPAPTHGPRRAAPAASGATHPGRFTYTKFKDAWCLRGPGKVPLNATVRVERRDGSVKTEVVRSVLAEYTDATIYGI